MQVSYADWMARGCRGRSTARRSGILRRCARSRAGTSPRPTSAKSPASPGDIAGSSSTSAPATAGRSWRRLPPTPRHSCSASTPMPGHRPRRPDASPVAHDPRTIGAPGSWLPASRPCQPDWPAWPISSRFASRGARCFVACSVSTVGVAASVARLVAPGGRLEITLSLVARDRRDTAGDAFGAADIERMTATFATLGLTRTGRPPAIGRGGRGDPVDLGAPAASRRRPRGAARLAGDLRGRPARTDVRPDALR